MLTELGEKYLKVKSLEARKDELEQEIEMMENRLELLGVEAKDAIEEAQPDHSFSDKAHIFAVNTKPGDTFLTAAEGNTPAEARDNLRSRIPAVCKIHCHIGEINQMVGTKRNF